MAIVKDDILEGCRGERDVYGWTEIERIIIVSEINLATTGWVAKVNVAIAAAGIAMRDAHPDVDYVYLRKISPVGLANNTIQLNCLYTRYSLSLLKRRENNTIEVKGGLIQANTNKDYQGNELGYLSYTYPATDPEKPSIVGAKQKIIVPVSKPIVIWNKFKIENESPEDKALEYVGAVNSSIWRSKPARTWRCEDISGTSNDSGNTYEVLYSFAYNPETWDDNAYYTRYDGKIPDDTVEDTSQKLCRVIREKNFSSLNL